MRDAFELTDLCVYLIAIALMLPVIQLFDRNSIGQFSLIFILGAPLPILLARLRFTLPAKLEQLLSKLPYIALLVGLLVFATIVVISILRWAT